MMKKNLFLPKNYKFGIVEGFFGKPWSWEARTDYAQFLIDSGYNSYIYAPKADQYLRKAWDIPFPDEHKQNLRSLSAHYQKTGLDFGIGFSPFEIYRKFDSSARRSLSNKLSEINEINPGTLCLQFDDMPGDLTELADQQSEVMAFVINNCQATNYIFCPTYYSLDPILAKQFGTPPENYLELLGKELPFNVDIFWTGPKIISPEYPALHLQEITNLLNRKPLIWDNYPVNDSKLMCRYLHLSTPEYDVNTLKASCSGHFCNPMNQPYLSRIPLRGISYKYAGNKPDRIVFEESCRDILPAKLSELIIHFLPEFEEKGLMNINALTKRRINNAFSNWTGHPAVSEIENWLDGFYEFDPDCLT